MRFFPLAFTGTVLLVASAGVNGQVYNPYPQDPYYRSSHRHHDDDDGYYNGPYANNGPYRNRGYGAYSGSLFGQVRNDLSRAAANNYYLSNNDRKHLTKAQQDLDRFQSRWAQGNWDNGRLDSAISCVQDLVNSRYISQRDRSVLANDLTALRQFRSTRGQSGYGYPYPNGPYQNGPYPYGRRYGYHYYDAEPRP